jgi:hypothetical protein
MYLPIKITDWSTNDYELYLQLLGVLVIIIMLIYIGLSSKESE